MNELSTREQTTTIQFRSNRLSENSIRAYTRAIKQYLRYCLDTGQGQGKDSAKKWLNTFDNANTYNFKRIILKEYLLKMYEKEPPARQLELIQLFEQIPTNKVKEAITSNFLTIEQIEQLIEQCQSEPMKLIIYALFWTGARIDELLNIKIDRCKRVGNHIEVEILGKCRKARDLKIPLELYKQIRKEFKHSKVYLFETRKNTKFFRNNISDYIRRAGERLGFSISAHTLRHSKAMYLKDVKKLSPDQIAKALGHSSVTTTLKYYFHGEPSAEDEGIE